MDKKEGIAIVRFHFAENSFDNITQHRTLPVNLQTTCTYLLHLLSEKLEMKESSLSLYEVNSNGSMLLAYHFAQVLAAQRIRENELLFPILERWSASERTKFVVKKNEELIKFYLGSDSKTFWTFRITEDTTCWVNIF